MYFFGLGSEGWLGCLTVLGLVVSVCLFFWCFSTTTPVFQVFSPRLGPVVSCVLAEYNFCFKNITFEDKRQAHRLLQKSLSVRFFERFNCFIWFLVWQRASHYLCFCQLIYQSNFVASQKVFPKHSLSPHNREIIFIEVSSSTTYCCECGHTVHVGCICSSILVQMRILPIVTTYRALLCTAETFQNTQTEIFLNEGKPEDKLQDLQSHCHTVLSSWNQIRVTPKQSSWPVFCKYWVLSTSCSALHVHS